MAALEPCPMSTQPTRKRTSPFSRISPSAPAESSIPMPSPTFLYEQATPMPDAQPSSGRGILYPSRAFLMARRQSLIPTLEVGRSPVRVGLPASRAFLSLSSIGSIPRASAMRFIVISAPKVTTGLPNPRMAQAGAWFW